MQNQSQRQPSFQNQSGYLNNQNNTFGQMGNQGYQQTFGAPGMDMMKFMEQMQQMQQMMNQFNMFQMMQQNQTQHNPKTQKIPSHFDDITIPPHSTDANSSTLSNIYPT